MNTNEDIIQSYIKQIDEIGFRNQINLSTSDAARLIGVSNSTLERWRVEKVGIEFNKVGRRIFYSKQAIAEWLLKTRINTISENRN